jgi:putative membrane protein
MNRRLFIHTSLLAAAGASITSAFAASAPGTIGKLPEAEFLKINKEAGAKVAAIKPAGGALSKGDEKLMLEIAAGGMMQLEASRVAVKMATSPDVRTIAQAEVDEQTGLSAKLGEIAAAKKVTLPTERDDKTKKMVAKLEGLSGAEFDKAYLKESGVKGHQLLNATMSKVQSKAEDATLKMVASTALPLIKTHLQVSQDEMADMG